MLDVTSNSQKCQVDTKCCSCFYPKWSNSKGTDTLYPPLYRELQLGLGCCLKKVWFFLQHQCWQRPPDILPHTNSSTNGPYCWTGSRNRRFLITPKPSKPTLLSSHQTPAYAPVMASKRHTLPSPQTMQTQGRGGCDLCMSNCRCPTHML